MSDKTRQVVRDIWHRLWARALKPVGENVRVAEVDGMVERHEDHHPTADRVNGEEAFLHAMTLFKTPLSPVIIKDDNVGSTEVPFYCADDYYESLSIVKGCGYRFLSSRLFTQTEALNHHQSNLRVLAAR